MTAPKPAKKLFVSNRWDGSRVGLCGVMSRHAPEPHEAPRFVWRDAACSLDCAEKIPGFPLMTPHAAPPVAQPLAPLSARPDADQRSGALGNRLQWAGLFLCFALIPAFFFAFEAMPFQDLPAHAGLIALRHRYANSAFDHEFLVLAPHIGPYSLFRFLGEHLMRVVGPLGAVRVLAMLPLFATPAALLYMRRTLFGDHSPLYGYIGILTTFGLMTLLGFASYQLGVAVMLFALTL